MPTFDRPRSKAFIEGYLQAVDVPKARVVRGALVCRNGVLTAALHPNVPKAQLVAELQIPAAWPAEVVRTVPCPICSGRH